MSEERPQASMSEGQPQADIPVDPRGAFGEHQPSSESRRSAPPDSESPAGSASEQPTYAGAPQDATDELSAVRPPRTHLSPEG